MTPCAYCGERPESHVDSSSYAECVHCAALPEDAAEIAAFGLDPDEVAGLTVN